MNRTWQFDYLKTFAIIFVIITHIFYYNGVSGIPVLFPYLVDMAIPIFMIVSGYVNALSCSQNIQSGFSFYTFIKYISVRLIPIYVPYIIIYLVEMVLMYFIQGRLVGLHEAIYSFLTGGWGPGSYYVPMMLQLVLCFPFFYILIKRDVISGSTVILGIQFAYEVFVRYAALSETVYRLIFIRYFVFVWFGMILFYYQDKMKNLFLFCCALCGGSYIFLIAQMHYPLSIFQYWSGTSMPTVLWAGPMVFFAIRFLKRFPGILDKVTIKTGASTYYIFLTQMIYFQLGFGKISTSFLCNFVCAILINCALGILFSYIFGKTIKGMLKRIRNGDMV